MSEKKKPRRLTPAQVAEKCRRDEAILALALRDVSERRIALQLKVSRNTVRRVRERYINARVAELESAGTRIRALHMGRYAVLHERAHQFLTANPSDARGLQAARDILDSMGRLLGLDAPAAAPVVTVNNAPATSIDLSKLTDQQLESLAVIMGLAPDPTLGQPTRSLVLGDGSLSVVERAADGTCRVVERRRAGFAAVPEPDPDVTNASVEAVEMPDNVMHPLVPEAPLASVEEAPADASRPLSRPPFAVFFASERTSAGREPA